MLRQSNRARRTGAVLPLVTVCLVGLLAFVALAIDIGLMAVARSQAQAAADVGALAGARTLNGNSGNNKTAAEAEAREAILANGVLGSQITSSQVTSVSTGVYRYNTTTSRFTADFVNPPGALEAYGAMRVVVNSDQQTYFGRVLGVNSMTVGAVATAVHRPRDLSVSLDFSGSMKFSSEFNYPPSVSNTVNIDGGLSGDPRFPRFGPWMIYPVATTGTPNPMQRLDRYVDSGGETHASNNMTVATANGPPIVQNFQTNAGTATASTNAFVYGADLTGGSFSITNTPVCTPTPDSWSSQYASGYVGDRWPLKFGTSTTAPTLTNYALNAAQVVTATPPSPVTTSYRNALFETNGYDWTSLTFRNGAFRGFTMGPGYTGKSFYMWPPDPRYSAAADPSNPSTTNTAQDASGNIMADWRKRFFLYPSASSGTKGARMDDNSRLFDATGNWRAQGVGGTVQYVPDYDAILKWIKTGPQVLPPSLRSGRVLYYSAIPDSIPMNWQTGIINSSASADQRYFKDYIDFVLGAGRHTRSKTLFGQGTNNTWSGTFGTGKITAKASLTGTPPPYMAYDDVPVHPRLHTWFGPLTMLGFMSINSNNVDYNWYAGTTYEAQTWQLKAGIRAALDDIKKNHPNDLASLNFWSSHNGYNSARVAMGKSYDRMTNCLYYPFSIVNNLGTVTTEKRPYGTTTPTTGNPSGVSSDNYSADIPLGDGGTNPTMGLMVSYNQFNWTSSWTGRNGAAKVVIMETDGVANQGCNGTFTALTGGRYNWTSISNGTNAGNGHPDAIDPAVTMAWIIAQDETGSKPWPTFPNYSNLSGLPAATTPTRRYTSVNGPGFSTSRSPAQVHTLAFGELFEPSTSSNMKTRALEFLRNVQIAGNTSPAGATSIESYKIITGTADERIAKIKEALERIMQGGVQVALIE